MDVSVSQSVWTLSRLGHLSFPPRYRSLMLTKSVRHIETTWITFHSHAWISFAWVETGCSSLVRAKSGVDRYASGRSHKIKWAALRFTLSLFNCVVCSTTTYSMESRGVVWNRWQKHLHGKIFTLRYAPMHHNSMLDNSQKFTSIACLLIHFINCTWPKIYRMRIVKRSSSNCRTATIWVPRRLSTRKCLWYQVRGVVNFDGAAFLPILLKGGN